MSGKILVTGASGFVGTRLVEALRLGRDEPVRAMIHDPAHAVRVARLDAELVRADLSDARSLAAAIEGCDRVVHCAYGTTGSARRRRELTGVATARLAELALTAGVSRFVHLSTAVVWGFSPGARELDESAQLPRRSRHPYVDGKLEAEHAVRAAVERGLPAVVLRPTNVYGPWAPAFTVGPVQALRFGAVALVGDGTAPSNTVFVDNLVAAILRALGDDAAVGETFLVDDANGRSWRDLYAAYAQIGGWEVRTVTPQQYRRAARRPAARVLREAVAAQPVLRRAAHAVVDRVPRAAAVEALGAAFVPSVPPAELAALQSSGVRFRTDKARDVLGWEPVVGVERALELTGDWLRFARLA